MSPDPAFLSRVLRLQIRDRYFCCCDAVSTRAFRAIRSCRGVPNLLAFGRLQIPARNITSGGRRYENVGAYREHAAVIRTPPRRIGRALALNKERQSPRPPLVGATIRPNAPGKRTSSSAI